MRITKQPSGGRGEYELSEYAPNGLSPNDLIEHDIILSIGDYLIRTDVRVAKAQGKNRLRINNNEFPHVHKQLSNALLLPSPTRSEQNITGGEPVLRNNNYVIKNIHFGEITKIDEDSTFVGNVLTIDAANNTILAEQIPVLQRIKNIEKIWKNKSVFPNVISDILRRHEEIVTSGGPIPKNVMLSELQKQVELFSNDLEIIYTSITDVVPALLSVLNGVDVLKPLPLDQIEHDQVQVLKREITRWQQFVRRRGAASVRFRKSIQEAYKFRCFMCGAQFPSTEFNNNPGVDAAHILPWSEYDLDEVYNGLALCKIHHWAFDERLLQVKFVDGDYFVYLNPDIHSEDMDEFSVDILKEVVGKVPESNLPTEEKDRPKPYLLDRLYTDSM